VLFIQNINFLSLDIRNNKIGIFLRLFWIEVCLSGNYFYVLMFKYLRNIGMSIISSCTYFVKISKLVIEMITHCLFVDTRCINKHFRYKCRWVCQYLKVRSTLILCFFFTIINIQKPLRNWFNCYVLKKFIYRRIFICCLCKLVHIF
jgi:hypothetical protein